MGIPKQRITVHARTHARVLSMMADAGTSLFPTTYYTYFNVKETNKQIR